MSSKLINSNKGTGTDSQSQAIPQQANDPLAADAIQTRKGESWATGDNGSATHGCVKCGSFIDGADHGQTCPTCSQAKLVALGGRPSRQKLESLIAWAQRDRAEVLGGWGTGVGAAAGVALGLLIASIASIAGILVLLLILYAAVLGALLGNTLAIPVFQRLNKASKFTPPARRWHDRVRVAAIGVWLVLPPATYLALRLAAGKEGIAKFALRLIGRLWAALLS